MNLYVINLKKRVKIKIDGRGSAVYILLAGEFWQIKITISVLFKNKNTNKIMKSAKDSLLEMQKWQLRSMTVEIK